MFLNVSKFTKLIKNAYKGTGLRVINDQGTIILEGSLWAAKFLAGTLPKEILGEIIKLIGNLPEPGEAFNYTEGGGQMTITVKDNRLMDEPKHYRKKTKLNYVTESTCATILDDEDGEKSLAFTHMLDVIDQKEIDKAEDDGEEIEQGYSQRKDDKYVIWSDGDITYLVDLIDLAATDERAMVLESLRGVKC